MNDNVQVINKNGDGIFAEGIAHIEIPSTSKKYIFYTLNEKVDNDLTKIYISETNPDMKVENPISDLEWDDLRKKMIKISHKEEVDDVVFLKMNDVTFNVGEPKKLAITAVAKQAFKDAQLSHTMSTNQSETPVTVGNTSTFFSQGAVETPTETPSLEPSIFANPPQPAGVTEVETPVEEVPVSPIPEAAQVQSMANEVPTPAFESQTFNPAFSAPVTNQALEVDMPKQSSSVDTTSAETSTTTTTTLNANQSAVPDASIFTSTPPAESSVVEQVQEISTQPDIKVSDNVSSTSNAKPIITDEEALKAINTIQEYINQESENNQ